MTKLAKIGISVKNIVFLGENYWSVHLNLGSNFMIIVAEVLLLANYTRKNPGKGPFQGTTEH